MQIKIHSYGIVFLPQEHETAAKPENTNTIECEICKASFLHERLKKLHMEAIHLINGDTFVSATTLRRVISPFNSALRHRNNAWSIGLPRRDNQPYYTYYINVGAVLSKLLDDLFKMS